MGKFIRRSAQLFIFVLSLNSLPQQIGFGMLIIANILIFFQPDHVFSEKRTHPLLYILFELNQLDLGCSELRLQKLVYFKQLIVLNCQFPDQSLLNMVFLMYFGLCNLRRRSNRSTLHSQSLYIFPKFLHLPIFILQQPLLLLIFCLFLLYLLLRLLKLLKDTLFAILDGLIFTKRTEELGAEVEELLFGFDDSMRHLSYFEHYFALAVRGCVQGFTLLLTNQIVILDIVNLGRRRSRVVGQQLPQSGKFSYIRQMGVRGEGALFANMTVVQHRVVDYSSQSLKNHGQKFLSTPAPHSVVSPWNCLMAGFVHPPKATKSEKEGLLSQCAYHNCWEATLAQPVMDPKMVCHIQREAQIAGTFPLDLMRLMISVRKAQLPLQSVVHPQPGLGLVSTSIHTIPQRLLAMAAIIWSTWADPDLLLQGNMQMSVISPAALALLRLLMMLASTPPQEQQPRMMAKEQPLLFMHWQVAVENSWETSTPSTQRVGAANSSSRSTEWMAFINNLQQDIQQIDRRTIQPPNPIIQIPPTNPTPPLKQPQNSLKQQLGKISPVNLYSPYNSLSSVGDVSF